jgi:predicted house-cleaning noncanonical NTP pyrophosphatase (MazG superfamily)
MVKRRQGARVPGSIPRRKQTKHSQFLPHRSVLLIANAGPIEIPAKQISSDLVGWKSLGLSALPIEWTPPFFLVSAQCFDSQIPLNTVNSWIANSHTRLALTRGASLMIRSSGATETMSDRGSLVSTLCTTMDVAASIEQLRTKVPGPNRTRVHWIVQQAVTPNRKGHLSNERRVSKEPRDWTVEFEPIEGHQGYAVPIGIRPWREGREPSSLDLSCASEAEIPFRLRQVAKWALHFSSRIHFEWVWDGEKVWIVQADPAEPTHGVDPTTQLPIKIHTSSIGHLQAFHPAEAIDYERYGKLHNAALYKKLGYVMPPFFLINDPNTMASLLSGRLSPAIEQDLKELIKTPLIIRTDGENIPQDKRQMLPRSDPLATVEEAKGWIVSVFSAEIKKLELASHKLCLVAHHFIPSVSSAWARAQPGNRIVRIESLWGIPEGLYWYSHDTFEIDTREVKLNKSKIFTNLPFGVSKHLRYKGTFVAADENGRWGSVLVCPPHDWSSSIKKQEWLFEIAHTTRQIAETMKGPMSVMWFVNNHPKATRHRVLPWYHSKSELIGIPRAAPRRKITTANDFYIKSDEDWHALQQRLQSGIRIERVVVEPNDATLIRNRSFAETLAELAVQYKFVIELSGGILSHVYYLLTKGSAQVDCIDLFGADEDRVEYNKLVRDKIPEIIQKRGEQVRTIRLKGDALITALRQKLVEEAFEALDARPGDDLIGELADVNELIGALCSALKVSDDDLKAVQKEKRQKRGGFEKGIMLAKTTMPHSIHQSISKLTEGELQFIVETIPEQVIVHPANLPETPLYRRPDLRQVEQQLEKLFAFATETNKLGNLKAALNFVLPIGPGNEREFVLTIELRRSGSTLRGNIRVHLLPSQLPIKFSDDPV